LTTKQKTYKGTLNGLPPQILGRVLKTLWDLSSPEQKRNIKWGHNREIDIFVRRELEKEIPNEEACGIMLDYSRWDSTVTPFDRFAESWFHSKFMKKECKQIFMNACKNMCFEVVVDDNGNTYLRTGQRGSGEFFWTSNGNTTSAGANNFLSISETLGIDIRTILTTVNEIIVSVSGKPIPSNITKKEVFKRALKGENDFKVFEFGCIPVVNDGDDSNIYTSLKNGKILMKGMEETLTKCKKIIRSGNKVGATMVQNFKDMEFCSHHYEPILVGKNARKMTDHKKNVWTIARENSLKIYYLPSRPLPRIMGKFPKTLKWCTANFKQGISMGNDIVKSKVMSYLLLYPHYRIMRIFCLLLLSILGDVKCKLPDRWQFVDGFEYKQEFTLAGALKSLFNVQTLDDIGTRHYDQENKELKVLRYNSSLLGSHCPMRISDILIKSVDWLKNQTWTVNKHIFALDKSIHSKVLTLMTKEEV